MKKWTTEGSRTRKSFHKFHPGEHCALSPLGRDLFEEGSKKEISKSLSDFKEFSST